VHAQGLSNSFRKSRPQTKGLSAVTSKEWRRKQKLVDASFNALHLLRGLTHKKLSMIFRKHLKGINGQMLENKGIIRVVPEGRSRVILDFHIFDILEGDKIFLLDQPIEHLVKKKKENILIDLARSVSSALHDHYRKGLDRPREEPMSIFFRCSPNPRGRTGQSSSTWWRTTASSTRVVDCCHLDWDMSLFHLE